MAEKRRSLASSHRKLSREWHQTKNGELTPQSVIPGSHKKVWWKCSNGHEWQAAVYGRTVNDTECPYCAGRYATPKSSLKALHPRIAHEWHPTKNGDLTPQQVRPASGKKVWWKCSNGHEWQALIYGRTGNGNGCPYCAGKRASATTSLKAQYPDIVRQWHRTKNGQLKPQQVVPGSHKKVWWKCSRGHEWQAVVRSRALDGNGCPYCAGQYATPETSLMALHPNIARQWHTTKNGKLKPISVRPGSNKKVWWKCSKGHEWQAIVSSRALRGYRCPYCSWRRVTPQTSLKALHPRIARQWHPTKNGEITPQHVVPGSNKKAWWKCSHGPDHEWQQTVVSRTNGTGACPFCAGRRVSVTNSLAGLFPAIAKQWHPTKNGKTKPSDVLAAAQQRAWWRCPVGHVYAMAIRDRTTRGRGCPACAGL